MKNIGKVILLGQLLTLTLTSTTVTAAGTSGLEFKLPKDWTVGTEAAIEWTGTPSVGTGELSVVLVKNGETVSVLCEGHVSGSGKCSYTLVDDTLSGEGFQLGMASKDGLTLDLSKEFSIAKSEKEIPSNNNNNNNVEESAQDSFEVDQKDKKSTNKKKDNKNEEVGEIVDSETSNDKKSKASKKEKQEDEDEDEDEDDEDDGDEEYDDDEDDDEDYDDEDYDDEEEADDVDAVVRLEDTKEAVEEAIKKVVEESTSKDAKTEKVPSAKEKKDPLDDEIRPEQTDAGVMKFLIDNWDVVKKVIGGGIESLKGLVFTEPADGEGSEEEDSQADEQIIEVIQEASVPKLVVADAKVDTKVEGVKEQVKEDVKAEGVKEQVKEDANKEATAKKDAPVQAESKDAPIVKEQAAIPVAVPVKEAIVKEVPAKEALAKDPKVVPERADL